MTRYLHRDRAKQANVRPFHFVTCAAQQAVAAVGRTSSLTCDASLSPAVKYHGLARLHLRRFRLLMRPQLNGGTLDRLVKRLMSLFQRVCRLPWPRFLALLTLLVGIWLTCLFAAYLIPTVSGHPDFQNDESGLAEGAALVIFPMVGLSSCALSYFLARRKNWARLTLVAVLGLACAAATAILGSRLLTWRFSTPDEIGEFVLAVGFLIIPLAVVAFLVNDQVAAAFRADVPDTQRGETR